MQCLICQKPTHNKKFCSRLCSGKVLKGNAIRKKTLCRKCNTEILRTSWRDRRRLCDTCNPNKKDWSKVTYQQILGPRLYQKHSRIRDLARKLYKQSGLPQKCSICGYDKHYELHHIKAIGGFSKNTPITIINDLTNLIALCPNHHWEADHKLL